MLQQVSCIAAQTEADGQRFIELGLAVEKLQVTGSVKFDIRVADELLDAGKKLRQQWGEQRPVLIAASTHQGEDEQILEAFAGILEQHPNVLLVLVPRHPERFGDVATLCRTQGFDCVLRSKTELVTSTTQILVGDTMGEMMLLFAASDIAFVGGSLVANGGHNYLEPAVLAMPILSGPHVFNFADISQILTAAGGMELVDDSQQLAERVSQWLDDSVLARQVGNAAEAVVENNRGAQQRLFEVIREYLA